MVPGVGFNNCATEPYMTQHMSSINAEGLVDNYTDLDEYFKFQTGVSDALKEALGNPDATVDDWIAGWESTNETHAEMMMDIACIGNAKALVAGVATLAVAVYAL